MRFIGDLFEERARIELERAGLTLLARSYNTRFGELDLIMRDGDTIAFVEVRYRKYATHGNAVESITVSKRTKLTKAAELWLAENSKWRRFNCRFDVVTYDGHLENAHFSWLRGAFDAQQT
jgi:putative endonuclease